MEDKLRMELDALPGPQITFAELEAMECKTKTLQRRRGVLVLAAAVMMLLLCGMGWAKSQYGMWMLYDSRSWSDVKAEADQYDILLLNELDGIPFLAMQVYGHVPKGASHAEALLNPRYKPVSLDYGYRIRKVSPDDTTEYTQIQNILGLSFGTTENELWRYYFGIDENGTWTECNVPGSYDSIAYKGITLQVGDTVWHYESEGRTVYTRWVIWVDEEKQVAFSINETDYTDPNRVVECAKAIIDLNSR